MGRFFIPDLHDWKPIAPAEDMFSHPLFAGGSGTGLKTTQDLFVRTRGVDSRVQGPVTMLLVEIAQPKFQFDTKGTP